MEKSFVDHNSTLLESAIYRPQQSAFGEDAHPTIWLKAAALFESIAKNHVFVAGQKDAEDFTVDMVTIKTPPIFLSIIAEWIEDNTKTSSS